MRLRARQHCSMVQWCGGTHHHVAFASPFFGSAIEKPLAGGANIGQHNLAHGRANNLAVFSNENFLDIMGKANGARIKRRLHAIVGRLLADP
jgi:hypothetical protein